MTTRTLPPPEALHTADQAALVLDVPAPTIRRWRRAGLAAAEDQLPSRGRGGGVWLFRLSELAPLAEAYHARGHAVGQQEAAPSTRG